MHSPPMTASGTFIIFGAPACAWEALLEVLTMEHAMEGRAPMAEPLREEEEEDWRRGSSSASRLVPQWAPAQSGLCPWGLGFGTQAKASGWLGGG